MLKNNYKIVYKWCKFIPNLKPTKIIKECKKLVKKKYPLLKNDKFKNAIISMAYITIKRKLVEYKKHKLTQEEIDEIDSWDKGFDGHQYLIDNGQLPEDDEEEYYDIDFSFPMPKE